MGDQTHTLTYSYFPGCTLKNKAQELDLYGRLCAKALGFELEEIDEWQCCGGVYPTGKNEIASKLPSVRALAYSRDKNRALVTLCSACYNVIKQVNDDLAHDDNAILKVNNYLAEDNISYHGETRVLHYLEVLRDEIGWDRLKAAVKNPLKGKRIGAYYGCLLLRPSKVMQFDDPENPKIIEDFIRAIGATPVIYSQRNECCGAYAVFEDEAIPKRRVRSILDNAQDMKVDLLVTSCPLCRYNLLKHSSGSNVQIVYFTELLADALGVKNEAPKGASPLGASLKEAVNA